MKVKLRMSRSEWREGIGREKHKTNSDENVVNRWRGVETGVEQALQEMVDAAEDNTIQGS